MVADISRILIVANLFCFVLCITRRQVLSFGDRSREVCRSPLGLESGGIKDSQLRATCYHYEFYLGGGHHADVRPRSARLNGRDAWCCLQRNMNDVHLTIDLEDVAYISGIATQGIEGVVDYYVKKFSIQTSVNGSYWEAVYSDQDSTNQVWNGNSDGLGTVTNIFNNSPEARYIRIHPLEYKNKMCLRLELYGCKRKNITTTPYPSSTSTAPGTRRKNSVHPTRGTAMGSSQPVSRSTVTNQQQQTFALVTTTPYPSSTPTASGSQRENSVHRTRGMARSSLEPVSRSTVAYQLQQTFAPVTTEVVAKVAARVNEDNGESGLQTYQVYVIVVAAVGAIVGVIVAVVVICKRAHRKRNVLVMGLTAKCTSQTSLVALHGYNYSQVVELKSDCNPEEQIIAV